MPTSDVCRWSPKNAVESTGAKQIRNRPNKEGQKMTIKTLVPGHHNGNAMGSVRLLASLIGGEWEIEPDGNGWHWEKSQDISSATHGLLQIPNVRALELARKGRFPLFAPSQSGEQSENCQIIWAQVEQRANDCNIDEIIVVRRTCNLPGLLAPDAYSVIATEVWRNIKVVFGPAGAHISADVSFSQRENK